VYDLDVMQPSDPVNLRAWNVAAVVSEWLAGAELEHDLQPFIKVVHGFWDFDQREDHFLVEAS
jgi:hypothetical protein